MSRINIEEPNEDSLSDIGMAAGVRIPRMVKNWHIDSFTDDVSMVTFECYLTKEMANAIHAWLTAERIKKGVSDAPTESEY